VTPADAVRVTTVVALDPAAAFHVFTAEVDAWWRRGPMYRFRTDRSGTMRFEPHVGGRLLEVYDEAAGDAYEVGRVLVWEPAARLVFTWRGVAFAPGQRTEVEVRFEAVESGTRVMLEHRGWDSLPAGHPARHGLAGPAFTRLIGQWWASLLLDARTHAALPAQSPVCSLTGEHSA
jgi:uncharacterized protein YndB with AHSA1/START domain